MSATQLLRAAAPHQRTRDALGPLADLPGTWVGTGFNLIARPDFHDGKPFFLQLNATQENLSFTSIGAPIPNRGSLQDDIVFRGVNYLQRVSDASTGGALHLEPGIWLNLPATTKPAEAPTVVRLSTVPHGDSLLAQGVGVLPNGSFTKRGRPLIAPADSTPLKQGTATKVTDRRYLGQFDNAVLPAGIPFAAVRNPNVLLTEAIAHQKIVQTTVLAVDTTTVLGGAAGGIKNVPFVVANADVISMSAIFWVETVREANGAEFLQLQYTQTVLLRFGDIDWPHISVATLLKQ